MELSFIIPVKDEEKSIEKLSQEIILQCKKLKKSYEIIFVDDGSTDKSYINILALSKKNKNIKVIKHRANFGKSRALMTGFSKAKGKIIFTLDGDLQDNPKEIDKFLKEINKGHDLINGWKRKRRDSLIITIPSKIGNYLIGKLTGLEIHDSNCGFKAYKKEVVKDLNIYGELYRFIPILLHQKGYKIAEVAVAHRRRLYGKSKYKYTKVLKIFIDLITVLFLSGYSSQPAHLFGSIGLIFFSVGFLMDSYVSFIKITTGTTGGKIPLLIAGVLFILLGVQLFLTGLIAEMIVSINQRNNNAR